MKESSFKDALKKGFAKAYDPCLFDKVVQGPLTGAGRPDLLVIGTHGLEPGVSVNIETKIKHNKPTPVQMYRIWEICRSGSTAVWVRLEADGKAHWYTLDYQEFLVTEPGYCEGVLETCKEVVDAKRREGVWEKYYAT